MKKEFSIYCIECTKSNKKYIGSTTSILNRWRKHRWLLKYPESIRS